MTLPEVAFFPHSVLPLFIFEPRYRTMLRDVLDSHRLFAAVGLDLDRLGVCECDEPPHTVASVGVVRACRHNPDGTSHLLLQGLTRIRVRGIVREKPYRVIAIEPFTPAVGAPHEVPKLRSELAAELRTRRQLGGEVPDEVLRILDALEDFPVAVDVAAHALCDHAARRQRLLEAQDACHGARLLLADLRSGNDDLRLRRCCDRARDGEPPPRN